MDLDIFFLNYKPVLTIPLLYLFNLPLKYTSILFLLFGNQDVLHLYQRVVI